jgi:signal transduction histidine kinase
MKPNEAGEFKFLAGGGEMGGRIRDFDWEHSALGPIGRWPPALLSTLSICLSARFPMAIYWGKEGVLLYNDAWLPILGDKHPWALGRAAREVWPEIWEAINPLFESVRATGQATWREDELLPMQRFGYTEECFFDYSFNPITGKSGEVEGILNVVQETTFRVLSERRTRLLQELASCSGAAKSERRAGELALAAMAKGPEDIPFALLYVKGPDGTGMRLTGATGLTQENLARMSAGDWPFEEARCTGKPVVVADVEARFGTVHAGRWPEPVTQALLLPVAASGQDALAAMLVTGVSPRRKLDEDYRRFFELAASHVASMLASASYEEERKRAEARAEFLGRLTQKLSMVSDEGEINRVATREIGEFLGAFRIYFYQTTSQPDKVRVLPDWRREAVPGIEGIYDLSQFGEPEWGGAMELGPVGIDDVRTHPWTRNFLEGYQSINTLAYVLAPFRHEGRWVASICMSSDQPRHWTEEEKALLENAVARVWPLIERARVEAALREANTLLADKAAHLEAIVQQRTAKLRETVGELESFSYSIAHDMRAPLRSLQGFSDILMKDHGPKLEAEPQRYLNLIAASARRMDNLIRDVLNYSRVVREELPMQTVDAGRLLRGIVDTYPMFAADKADVELQGPFPAVLGNEAMLMQIFSNLMGNAVKFVAPGVKPQLKVWAERRDGWVRLLVRDNGIGIAPGQHKKIFAIFQRVDKRYEGTGIGLAIVKKAAERMGGTVGLESEPGHGSTFWIEVQAAPSPEKA